MPEVAVYSPEGVTTQRVTLRDDVFGITPHTAVLHQAVVRQLANARVGTHDTKTRGEVSGGGRKPWRQKGTGRARQGSRRAPHWRGGGVAFGPHPRDYHQDMPKKMRRLALRSALASKTAEGRLLVLERLEMEAPSTRRLRELLERLGVERSALLVLGSDQETVRLSARNLPHVRAIHADSLNVVDLLRADHVVVALDLLRHIEERLAAQVRGGRPVGLAEGAAEEASPEAEAIGAAAELQPGPEAGTAASAQAVSEEPPAAQAVAPGTDEAPAASPPTTGEAGSRGTPQE